MMNWTDEHKEFVGKLREQGISWGDVQEKFNEAYGESLSADTMRKAIAPTVSQEVQRDREIERLKAQRDILNRKYKTAIREQNFQETLLQAVRDQIQVTPPVPPPLSLPAQEAERLVREVPLLLLSCLHIGEVVSEEETAGFGKYDFNTFSSRLSFLANKIIRIKNILAGYHLPKLSMGWLGDFVCGTIHDELVESAEGTVIEWNFLGALVLVQFIQQLLTSFEEVEIVAVFGNHGRMKKKPHYKQRYVNWDYVLYNTVATMLAQEPRVTFRIPKSFFVTHEVENQKFLYMHGDNINSWQGYPYYGVDRAVYKLKALLASRRNLPDHVAMAHFHQILNFEHVPGEVLVNSSVKGGDEFALGKLFTTSQPKQWFFGVHKEEGITWRYPLNLWRADPAEDLYPYSFEEPIHEQARTVIGA